MNYVNNGDYYLVAKYNDLGIDIIPINQKWYLGDRIKDDNKSYKNDISSIDIVTTKFKNEQQMKRQMYKNGYIKSEDADIFIIHKHRYNGKQYINEYEIIYKNEEKNERMNLLYSIGRKRLFDEQIDETKLDEFMNKFVSKFNSSESFRKFVQNPYSTIDKYFISELLKNMKVGFDIKYIFKNKVDTYPFIRNIISMWNIYDTLYEKNKNCSYNELATKIISDYVEMLNSRNSRRNYYNSLIKITKKDNSPGQITLEEYFEPEISYEEKMQTMVSEERALKEAPFDDKYLQMLLEKYGIEKVFSNMKNIDLNKLSLGDKLRLGLIDYVDYKRLKRENGRKYN